MKAPERNTLPKEKHTVFSGGAKRHDRKPLVFLVPRELLDLVAETRMRAELKYGFGNWKLGDRLFFVDCLSHAIIHLMDAPSEAEGEDFRTHLAHAASNLAFIAWALDRGIVTVDDFRKAAELYAATETGM